MGRNSALIILFLIGLFCPVFRTGWAGNAFSQPGDIAEKREGQRLNPFLTQREEKALAEIGNAIPLDYLKVSAIFYSALNCQSRTIIDGRVLVQGDNIDNKQIIKINPEDVVLEDSQGQYVAKMNRVMSGIQEKE